MFQRIFLGDNAALIGIVAFAVTAVIFFGFVWCSCRMRREQSDRLANLPFNSDSDDVRHDPSA